jgi:hypothetical protein
LSLIRFIAVCEGSGPIDPEQQAIDMLPGIDRIDLAAPGKVANEEASSILSAECPRDNGI